MTYEPTDFFSLDDLLTPEDRQVRAEVRTWVNSEFLPGICDWNERAEFPLAKALEIARFGTFGGTIEGYGCAGMSPLRYGLIMRELERGDSGLRTLASVQGALAMNAIHQFGSDEQKQAWLPAMAAGHKLGCFALTEPGFGSNPAGMVTRAIRTPAGYRIDGEKLWIGMATHADVAVVWAKVDGLPGVSADSAAAVRGFLIERGTPGFEPSLIERKLSLRAAITCRIRLNNCHVPESSLLPLSTGIKSPFLCLNHARYGIAWGALGAASACFEEARDYALNRVQFGRPIGAFQLVQRKLALMQTELAKGELIAHRLAQLKNAGRLDHIQISLAKRNNVAIALDIARSAREILGGIGILGDFQSFRHLCNLESVKTYEGTDDMHLLILGEHLTGHAAYAK